VSQQPINLIHIGPYPLRGGGISSVTSLLADGQRRDPCLRVDVIPTSVDGGYIRKSVAMLKALAAIRRRCRREPTPVLHLHSSTGSSFRRKALVVRMAATHSVPCLLHVHGSRLPDYYQTASSERRRWITRKLDHADHIVAVSATLQEFLQSVSQTPVELIHNAVDVDAFAHQRRYERGVNLLFLGGVALRDKGAFDLLDAFIQLRKETEDPSVRLTIAGGGEVAQVRDVVAKHDLASVVEVTGWVDADRKQALLRDADIYILPSHNEGLPVSMLEAMASGLPVIVSPVGGIPEAISDKLNGLIVQPRDVGGLAQAIRLLHKDAALRQRLGEAAQTTVREKFEINQALKRFMHLYRTLAGRNR
jgi:glycosyltransferase involved in cell wall biosynthesis